MLVAKRLGVCITSVQKTLRAPGVHLVDSSALTEHLALLTQAHANASDFAAGIRRGSEYTKPQNLQALIGGAKRLEALLVLMTRAMLKQQTIDTRTANFLAASTTA
jgi:hypothetical protein